MIAYACLLWLLLVPPASAHDLGMIEAHLSVDRAGRYDLSAMVAPSLAYPAAPLGLPDRCRPLSGPGGATWFSFVCDGAPLHAGDVLVLPWRHDSVLLSMHHRDGSTTRGLFIAADGAIRVDLASLGAGSGSVVDAAWRFTILGIGHILTGIDHLLFILALLLVVRGPWQLLKTVTAFTVAHSLTLGLATLGWVRLPDPPVEAAIALSIVLVAAEGLRADDPSGRRPWLTALVFGMLHGFGFAGALSALGLPTGDIPLALLCFNLGVEAGQLAFIAAILILLALARRLPVRWPAAIPLIPGYVIGSIAMAWLFERLATILKT